jgi:hypothetical protein
MRERSHRQAAEQGLPDNEQYPAIRLRYPADRHSRAWLGRRITGDSQEPPPQPLGANQRKQMVRRIGLAGEGYLPRGRVGCCKRPINKGG